MAIKDLREWIKELEEQNEVARIKEKVDWNLELGGITQETFDRGGPRFCVPLTISSLSA